MPKAKPSKPSPKPAAKAKVPAARGRPVGSGGYRPTPQERQMVEMMVGFGIPAHDIVKVLPSPQKGIDHISHTTLEKHYRVELNRGKVRADMQVVGALYKNAVENGNVAAQIWWTKTQLGWKEQIHVSVPGNEPGEKVIEDEDNVLEAARRVAFTLALGARAVKKDG